MKVNKTKSSETFPNYMEVEPIIPQWVWYVLRAFGILTVIVLCVALFLRPREALFFFWGVFIPCLPLLFFIAPGFWRNVCPMATANQIPRDWNFTRAITLPEKIKEHSYLIAMIIAFAIIPARKYLFESSGVFLAILIIFCMLSAFLGGFFFKGKSGWCSSFCPLLPFQHAYGQTPFVNVRNAHCRPCIGCTKNCYDFNPNIAAIASLKEDKFSSGYRKLFISILPGLNIAFFMVHSPPDVSIVQMYLQSAMIVSCSMAVFFMLTIFFRERTTYISTLFAAASINLAYWFLLPILQHKYLVMLGVAIPDEVRMIFLSILWGLTAVWLFRSYLKEQKLAVIASNEVASVQNIEEIRHYVEEKEKKTMVTILPLEKKVMAKPETVLLDILEKANCPIEAGCRMGLCGSDPVSILEGADSLSKASANERSTLERLNLDKNCRMACCVHIQEMAIVVSLETSGKQDERERENVIRPVAFEQIKNVVVIGNGVAGMSAVFELQRLHPDCKITVIAKEPYHFYNRMGITRLIYGKSVLESLMLFPKESKKDPRLSVFMNTAVKKIHRDKKEVEYGVGEYLPYDKLILAMGGSSFIPEINNVHSAGVYGVREADDCIHLRAFIQKNEVRSAIIIGGGVLGIETAYALSKINLQVLILERDTFLMHKQLGEKASTYLKTYLETLSINILCNVQVKEILAKERAYGVLLNDKIVKLADIVIMCAGVRSNIELAREAELSVNRGVVVDARMCTSDPDIYAIGDVAEVNGKVDGLWGSCVDQAKIASQNLLGFEIDYTGTISHVILKVPGICLVSIGSINPGGALIYKEDLAAEQFVTLCIVDNRLVGVILIGVNTEIEADKLISLITRNTIFTEEELSSLSKNSLLETLSLLKKL